MKFIGNKHRLTDFLIERFDKSNIDSNSNVLDLFSGTGSVSNILSNMGYNVTAVDILKACYYITYSKLNTTPQLENKIVSELLNKTDIGFITNNYSELAGINVFTTDIANHIDGCLDILKQHPEKLSNEFHFLMSTLIEEADFRSNIMGSYESFYKRGWRKQALKQWSFNMINNKTNTNNTIINSSIESFFENNTNQFDMVYADPPYNRRQYGSVFHTLESIATFYDGDVKGKNNRSTDIILSDFSKATRVQTAFDNLFYNVAKITDNFYLSYSNEGMVSKEVISDIGKKYFKYDETYIMEYRRMNTNQKDNKRKVYEILYRFYN